MSDTRENGGPAFPMGPYKLDQFHGHGYTQYFGPSCGMSLRDYFAGQALANMRIHENSDNPLYWERVARSAYIAADAMLTERAKATALGERNGGAG